MPTELRTSSLNAEDVIKIATAIVEHLTLNPGDFAGAGQMVGLSRDKVMSLIDRFPELFSDIEEQYFDKLNSLCRIAALGKELPPGHEDFNFNMARTLLTWRQKEVAQIKKEKRVEKKENTINVTRLDASKIIQEHLSKYNSVIIPEIGNVTSKENSGNLGRDTDSGDIDTGDFDIPTDRNVDSREKPF